MKNSLPGVREPAPLSAQGFKRVAAFAKLKNSPNWGVDYGEFGNWVQDPFAVR
jgi:hypothetical protein